MTAPTQNPNSSASAILVIDDDPGVRQTLRWALEDEGLVVITASNGREALQQVAAARPRLIVLDMGMPVLDGDGFALEFHQLYGSSIPIVVLTADGHADEKAGRVGAFDYLQKPFNIDELISTVWRGLTDI